MSEYSTEYRKKVGAVLLKLKGHGHLFGEEIPIANFLIGQGLVQYIGPPKVSAKIVSAAELANEMQVAALAYYELSGLGEGFVQKYNEAQLSSGRFLFPEEPAWHDRWPWKYLLPAAISLVVSLIVNLVSFFLVLNRDTGKPRHDDSTEIHLKDSGKPFHDDSKDSGKPLHDDSTTTKQ